MYNQSISDDLNLEGKQKTMKITKSELTKLINEEKSKLEEK